MSAHAEKCPVCKGRGTVKADDELGRVKCHGCNGLGWVTVGFDYTPIIQPPYTSPWAPKPWPWGGTIISLETSTTTKPPTTSWYTTSQADAKNITYTYA